MPRHRFGFLSDTHGALHPDVFEHFAGVEAIFHAGDVEGEELLDDLEALAPVHAVHGNCDFASARLPGLREIRAPFGLVILTHSHLVPTNGRPEALAEHFRARGPRLVVYGHTHQAYVGLHGGIRVLNPGPAGRGRGRPSVCVLEWTSETDQFEFEFRPLEWKSPRRS
jgi:putative phosphoesterase